MMSPLSIILLSLVYSVVAGGVMHFYSRSYTKYGWEYEYSYPPIGVFAAIWPVAVPIATCFVVASFTCKVISEKTKCNKIKG